MRTLLHRNDEAWALLRRTDQANKKLALFIHGFKGNYLTTWGTLPDLFEKEADKDQDFADWDFLFLGYDTATVQTYLEQRDAVDAAMHRGRLFRPGAE